ncbi:MAG: HigA family addiction module antitoxin [Cyanobacteria bacterium P01_G01_bin.54]
MTRQKLTPVHPGEVLQHDFLHPFQLSPADLAQRIRLDQTLVQFILDQQAPITANIALRLSLFFGTSPEVWMNLQSRYDLEIARDNLEEQLATEIRPYP